MRICVRFILIFVFGAWCECSNIIILDTNVCTATLELFNNLRNEIFHQNLSKTRPTYGDIWAKFTDSDSVDIVLSEYFTEVDKIRFKPSITITKLILAVNENRPEMEIHVPAYIYNEAVNGISSKMSKEFYSFCDDYDEFFASIPVRTIVDNWTLTEGTDFPEKCRSSESNALFPIMTEFLSKTMKSSENLKNLIQYLNEDTINKQKQTEARLSDLSQMCENVKSKIALWDKPMKIFLSNNGFDDYKTGTDQLSSVAGRIPAYFQNKFKNIDFNKTIDVIANRLIQFKEEFDWFDLQIYLYAMEKNASIWSLNTQAFQEINDPVFLDFFRNTKILNPSINFKGLIDLDRLSDCKSVMELVIKLDFENDYRILTNLQSITNLHRNKLDVIALNSMFHSVFSEIRQQLINGTEMKLILREMVLIDALDLIKMVDKKIQIDQQVVFNSDAAKVIVKQILSLNFIDKFLFNSTLNIDDFIKPEPFIDSIPKTLHFDKQLAEGVVKGLSAKDHNLKEFLKIFKDKSVRTQATKYAKIIYFESNFRRESLKKALGLV